MFFDVDVLSPCIAVSNLVSPCQLCVKKSFFRFSISGKKKQNAARISHTQEKVEKMRICLLLPRFTPTSNSPPCRVIRKFSNSYQVGLATAASALAHGHEVTCVLIGPSPSAENKNSAFSPSSSSSSFSASSDPSVITDDIDIGDGGKGNQISDGSGGSSADKNSTNGDSNVLSLDPAIQLLLDAYPSRLTLGMAEPPSAAENANSFIDAISDPRGARHWAKAINSAAATGLHVLIDAVGPEVCGGCKYLLQAPEFGDFDDNVDDESEHTRVRRSNAGHMWSRFDFPDSDGLVKAMCQVYASNKMVSSLGCDESLLRRAPEPSVIPPSVRDASKVNLPLTLQKANLSEATLDEKQLLQQESELEAEALKRKVEKQAKMLEKHQQQTMKTTTSAASSFAIEKKVYANEDDVAGGDQQEEEEEQDGDNDALPPPASDTLVLSLVSWRLLSLAEWQQKRVLWLPEYNGGDRSEVCVAACEDTYRYFTDMFKQKTFDDFSFIAIPPLIREGVAEKAKSAEELVSLSAQRLQEAEEFAAPAARLQLKKEILPFDIFRAASILPAAQQTKALGIAAAMSNCVGFSSYLSADEIADTIISELEQYLEDDMQIRTTGGMWNPRGKLEERRSAAKKEKLKLASKLRFGIQAAVEPEGKDGGNVAVPPGTMNPLVLVQHARMLEIMYNTF